MHLNTAELVDIAEGAQPEESTPHLAGCAQCREQVSDLRAMLSAAQEVAVPEPSPLFWDHLSARVSEAVTAEGEPGLLRPPRTLVDRVTSVLSARAFQAAAVVAAGLLIAVLLNGRVPSPGGDAPASPSARSGAVTEPLGDVSADDVSLTLVASMTDDQDLETVREAGLAPRGTAEHAVTHMSDGELRELRRLLREELARSGA
jgi:hypothetical protein